MPNLNKVQLIGHLTRDPEMRVTPKGTAICQFSLGINRDWKNEAGEKQTEVLFVDLEAWGKTGEIIAKYVTKGKPLYVDGRLKLDQWEDKTTHEKRSRMKVVVENFQFLGIGEPAENRPSAPAKETPPPQYRAPASAPKSSDAGAGNLDEDVPFGP